MFAIIFSTLMFVILICVGTLLLTDSDPWGLLFFLFAFLFIILDAGLIAMKCDDYANNKAKEYSKIQQDHLVNQIGNNTVEIELYKLEINKKDTVRYYQIKK